MGTGRAGLPEVRAWGDGQVLPELLLPPPPGHTVFKQGTQVGAIH